MHDRFTGQAPSDLHSISHCRGAKRDRGTVWTAEKRTLTASTLPIHPSASNEQKLDAHEIFFMFKQSFYTVQ